MYFDEVSAAAQAAKTKSAFLSKNPAGYFLSAMLAGAFIGFGILLIFSIGGLLSGQPYAKVVMGASFGIALSLVVIAGAELFTGNNLVMATGALSGSVAWKDAVKLWIVCYLGKWIGSILLALLFVGTDLSSGAVGEFIAASAAAKMSVPFVALFLRGLFCNVLVCLDGPVFNYVKGRSLIN